MKRSLSRCLSASAVMALVLLSAAPGQAADRFARGLFDLNTMQGWQRATGASAMAYASLPFHAAKSGTAAPHVGFAMTAPFRVNGAGVLLHTNAPRLIDLRFNATDVNGGWTSALHIGSAKAWTYDPTAASGERHHTLFESGPSWVVVGLLGAAVIAGTFALTENGT
jgi:predicted RecA/RadA family phage recombinase